MNKRFAQIIAECTDRDGTVDRQKLFTSLSLDRSDPTAPLFDAAAFTWENLRQVQQASNQAVQREKDLLAILQKTASSEIRNLAEVLEHATQQNATMVQTQCAKATQQVVTLTDAKINDLQLCATDIEKRTRALAETLELFSKRVGLVHQENNTQTLLFTALLACVVEGMAGSWWWVPPLVLLVAIVLIYLGAFRKIKEWLTGQASY